MRLPSPPRPGDKIEARTIAELIDCVRENAVQSSSTIMVKRTSSGTLLETINRRTGSSTTDEYFPFEVYQDPGKYDGEDDGTAWRTFRTHRGRVSCKPAENADDSNGELIIRPDASSTHYVWLQIQAKVVSKYAPFVQSVTIHDGTDPRSGGWDSYPNQNQQDNPEEITAFVIVAELQVGSDDEGTFDLSQNVRSDLTLGLPVDEVEMDNSNPSAPALLVYKKIMITGPDNFWECPSEPQSSQHSESRSSQKKSSKHSSQHNSSHTHTKTETNTATATETHTATQTHGTHTATGTHTQTHTATHTQTGETLQTYETNTHTQTNTQTHGTHPETHTQTNPQTHTQTNPQTHTQTNPPTQPPTNPPTKNAIVEYVNELALIEYVALYCSEMPDVRFEDVIRLEVGDKFVQTFLGYEAKFPIDKIFQAVTEPGTAVVCGYGSDQPVALGVFVSGSEIVVRAPSNWRDYGPYPNYVVARISAVRRGFLGKRFERFTKAEAVRNNEFWAQALRERS